MRYALANRMIRTARLGLAALGALGCAQPNAISTPSLSVSAPADLREGSAILGWNEIARELVTRNGPNQQAALRLFAYLTLAQHNAVVTIDHHEGAMIRGAVAGASAEILTYVFPGEASYVENTVTALEEAERAGRPQRDSFTSGLALGRSVGAQIAALARTDRFDAVWGGTVPVGSGYWRSSLEPARPPLLPLLGEMRPFFMREGDQFRPPAPPAVGSPELDAALAEVRRISDARTQDQVEIARKWAGTTGSLVAGFWNEQAADLIRRFHMDEKRAARTLALMHMAVMDANIACHDAKYAYWVPRPSQLDPGITLVVGLPNHPSYPSNHACDSGAAVNILARIFPSERERLLAMGREAGISRVYAGIHYAFDATAGFAIADRVSELAQEMAPRGRSPFRLNVEE